ncbi:DUF1592 domain-containing protein [Polyangium aurulentum]|uniref:DUF1592 domain-containing protein n=1 Tax=Polyangium aurulentum TaxID=2567896 RepID=UPI0010AE6D14|nr:DUF1592 domain-containing protein [Polyangium aurulentum]UQA59321.1 DUF1592 domain-containing protein [Polyangium aurulentum]
MRSRNILALVLLSAAAAACIGQIGGPGIDEDRQPICGVDVLPGPSPIRRMTRFEYNNTVRDLLGDTTGPANDFGAEEEALGFNNNAANLVTSSTLAEKYMRAAEGIASRATDPLTKVVACDPAVIGEEACAKEFIATFGKRAFRRPLAQDEADVLFGLYQVGRAQGDFRQGIQMVIEAALQAPEFLYRVELGGEPFEDEMNEGLVHLDDWEMASRLSYFLWGTMPDDALFAAAEAGELQTKEQVAAQARRMLDDPRAHEAIRNFHLQWLDYNRIANVSKDGLLFPTWSAGMKELMRKETEAFLDAAVFEEGGDLETLLTAPYSYMNAELAAFYGVPPEKAPPGPDFQRVDLDPSQRAGLVTMGSMLTIHAHSNQTSPVHRGKLVREAFLCDQMPPPPADVMITVPAPDPNSTARERFAAHSENPSCKACHQLMDGIGFGFENYDGVGRYRTEESGKPIDATGTIIKSDIDGDFEGAVELAYKLADSQKAQDCYTKQWFRFAYGRGETKEDVCTMDALSSRFAASGGNIKELLVELTQTDAFMLRHAGGAQ